MNLLVVKFLRVLRMIMFSSSSLIMVVKIFLLFLVVIYILKNFLMLLRQCMKSKCTTSSFFTLKDDGDVARVRFMYNSMEDVIGYAVHEVEVDGKKRYLKK